MADTVAYFERRVRYEPETGRFFRVGPPCREGVNGVGHAVPGKYVYLRVGGKRYAAHRLAWFMTYGWWPAEDIDHVNGDKQDNRIANLREASRSLNNANTRSRARSGLKGVVQVRNRYRAQITIGRKPIYLGLFDTPQRAHAAYVCAAKTAFGEYSRTK